MLRPALILLTLFLASCVSDSAQEMQAPCEGAEEIQQEDARPAVTLLLPKTLVCVFPGGPHHPFVHGTAPFFRSRFSS